MSPNTVHHALRALRRLFSVCNLPSPTRDSRLVVPDQVPSNLKIPSWAEVVKKLEAIKKVDIVEWGWLGLIAYTGIRRSEAARLNTEDVDLDEEVLHVRHAKVAKQPRTLPMPKGLVTVADCGMQQWNGRFGGKFGERPWLLPGANEDERRAYLDATARRWKVKLHSRRHAFASELARRGVPVDVIARLLGHSISGTTMRYAHGIGARSLPAVMEKVWSEINAA